MKKAASILSLILIATNSYSNELFQHSKINDNMTIDYNKKTMKINNFYMTNYLLRSKTTNNEHGEPIIISNNNQAIDFSNMANLEWNGWYPSVDFSFPKRNKSITSVDLDNYHFSGGQNKENSSMVIRGANLVDLVNNFPKDTTQAVDTLTLFFLNSMRLADIGSELIGNAGSIKKQKLLSDDQAAIINKFKPLAETILNYQSLIENMNECIELNEAILSALNEFSNIAGDKLNSEMYHVFIQRFQQFKEVYTTLAEKLGVTIQPNEKSNAYKSIAGGFKKAFKKSSLDVGESYKDAIKSSAEEFVKNYTEVEKEGREQLISKIISTIYSSTDRYKLKLDIAYKKSTNPQKRKQIRKKINALNKGRGILLIAGFIHSAPEVFNKFKNNPEMMMPILNDIANSALHQLVLSIKENQEIIAFRATQHITKMEGRARELLRVRKGLRKANGYLAAFDIGATAGNKLIPFLWDAMFGPNYLRTSIINGELAPYGRLLSKVTILDKYEDKVFKTYNFNSDDLINNELTKRIEYKLGHSYEAIVSMAQPEVFQNGVTPWKMDSTFPPQTLFESFISGPSNTVKKMICGRNVLFQKDVYMVIHKNQDQAIANQCGSGLWLGDKWYKKHSNHLGNKYVIQEKINNENFLPSEIIDDSNSFLVLKNINPDTDEPKYDHIYISLSGYPLSQNHNYLIKFYETPKISSKLLSEISREVGKNVTSNDTETLNSIKRLSLNNIKDDDLQGLNYLTNLSNLTITSENLSKIDLSKNKNLTSIYIYSNNIKKINLSRLKKLKFVDIDGTGNPYEHHPLKEKNIILNDSKEITHISLKNTKLNDYDFGFLTNLKSLNISFDEKPSPKIDNYNLKEYKNLNHLGLINLGLESINLQNNTNLKTLDLSENNLKNIDLSNVINLYRLSLDDNKLASIEILGNEMASLSISGNPLRNIDISNLTNLNILHATNLDEINKLDVSNNNNIIDLYVGGKNLSYIDFSNLNKLETLSVIGSEKIKSINLENNSSLRRLNLQDLYSLFSLDFSNNQSLKELRIVRTPITSDYIIGELSKLNSYKIPHASNVGLFGYPNPFIKANMQGKEYTSPIPRVVSDGRFKGKLTWQVDSDIPGITINPDTGVVKFIVPVIKDYLPNTYYHYTLTCFDEADIMYTKAFSFIIY